MDRGVRALGSAALLAELALSRLQVDWNDPAVYGALRVGDLACGGGALLSAAYDGIGSRYRMTGQDDCELRRSMMEKQIVAADIMPVAACLAASQLAVAHPAASFGGCRVYTMLYGAALGGLVALGALDLVRGSGCGLVPGARGLRLLARRRLSIGSMFPTNLSTW